MLRSSPLQQRSQYQRNWGNFPTVDACPNASGYTGTANAAAGLEVGDEAYVTTGATTSVVVCIDAGTIGGLNAIWRRIGINEYQGFQSSNLADYYVVPAASGGTVAPGANAFIVVVLVVPFVARTLSEDMVAQCAGGAGGAARGWRINWTAGNLSATVYDGGASAVTAVAVGTYNSNLARGHMAAIALRVFQSGGTQCQLWIGPALMASAAGVANVTPANNAADRMRIASGILFGGERALNGGVYGVGYFAGTQTDDQMRTLMGAALQDQIVPAGPAWTNRWPGRTVVTAPASWLADAGPVNLERVGAPTGSAAYFPPA